MCKKFLCGFCFLFFFSFSLFSLSFGVDFTRSSQAFASEVKESIYQEKIDIVATSFHEYDWLCQIVGVENTRVSISLLIDNGVDIHSFEPTMHDINRIAHADVFIHNGGASDAWVQDILAHSVKKEDTKAPIIFNVMQELGDVLREEAMVEGMQEGAHHHGHRHRHGHRHGHEHGHESHAGHAHDNHSHVGHEHDEYGNCIILDEHKEDKHQHESAHQAGHEHDHAQDHAQDHVNCSHDHAHTTTNHLSHADEHVWLSLKNAMIICEKLNVLLSELDPLNKEVYTRNTQKYIDSLKELDEKFKAQRSNASRNTIIVADRFPFLYMMEEYGINYFAAFHGCSAETEASFKTIAFLTEKLNTLNVKSILILENGMRALAQTIVKNSKNADCAIRELSSMQSIAKENIAQGISYYSIMEENFEILNTVLSE